MKSMVFATDWPSTMKARFAGNNFGRNLRILFKLKVACGASILNNGSGLFYLVSYNSTNLK